MNNDFEQEPGERQTVNSQRLWPWIGIVALLCGVAVALGIVLARGANSGETTDVVSVDTLDPVSSAPVREEVIEFHLSPVGRWDGTPVLIPAEAATVYGLFRLPQGVKEDDLSAVWYWRGIKMGDLKVESVAGPDGVAAGRVALTPPNGGPQFGIGVGEVEAHSKGSRVARGSFVASVGATQIIQQKEPSARETGIKSITGASGVDASGRAVRNKSSFRADEAIYVVFEYAGADAGATLAVRWYNEGREVPQARSEVVAAAESGWGHAWIAGKSGTQLPPGNYTVSVSYGGESRVLGSCKLKVDAVSGEEAPGGPQASNSNNSIKRSRSSGFE